MPDSLDDAKIPELKQQAIEWLVRLRADDMTEAEMGAFADWLARDYRHAEAFGYAEDLFDDMVLAVMPGSQPEADAGNIARMTSAAGMRKNRQANQASVRYRRLLPVLLSLAAVWLFAVILVMPDNSHPLDRLLSDFHTETGEFRNIQLADGSEVLLNTNSAVSVDYGESKRVVTLHHGQARFTVAKDLHRPFEVKAGDLRARALGTVFEVYRSDADEVSVTVQQHAVRVDINGLEQKTPAAALTVQAGQKLRYRLDGALPQLEPVELDQAGAWQQHRLSINDRPLSELVAELNRYRVGRVFLADPQLSKLRVTGVFSLDHPDQIVDSVSDVLGLKQTRLAGWWILLHR